MAIPNTAGRDLEKDRGLRGILAGNPLEDRATKIRTSSGNMPSPYGGVQAPSSKIRMAGNSFANQGSLLDRWDENGYFRQGSLKGNIFGEGGRIVRPGMPVRAQAPLAGNRYEDKPVEESEASRRVFGQDTGLAAAVSRAEGALRTPVDGMVPFISYDTDTAFSRFKEIAERGYGSPELTEMGLIAVSRIGSRGSPRDPRDPRDPWEVEASRVQPL